MELDITSECATGGPHASELLRAAAAISKGLPVVCGRYPLLEVLRFVELLWNTIKVKRVKPHFDWSKVAAALELDWTADDCEALWVALASNGIAACLAADSPGLLASAAGNTACLADLDFVEKVLLSYADRQKPTPSKKRAKKVDPLSSQSAFDTLSFDVPPPLSSDVDASNASLEAELKARGCALPDSVADPPAGKPTAKVSRRGSKRPRPACNV